MITKMTGTLSRVTDDEARVEIGPFEYAVLVPEAVRRQLQLRVGQELSFHISEYYEGNQTGSRMIPRKVGFLHEGELELFDLLCSVEKIGVKKALRAMSRSVKEIAEAIARSDTRWLSTLPGIGAATAEQVVTTLRRKVTHLAVTASPGEPASEAVEPTASVEKAPGKRGKKPVAPSAEPLPSVDPKLIDDVYQALMVLGHNPVEARTMLDGVLTSGRPFKTMDEALQLIYAGKK